MDQLTEVFVGRPRFSAPARKVSYEHNAEASTKAKYEF